jgi:hypothetical protein
LAGFLVRRYAGTYGWDRLLAEPPVRRELVLLMGPEFEHLKQNLTGGRILVYSRATGYDGLPICIMDWITQANSEHRDRFQKPNNVDLIPPRASRTPRDRP